ncbi:MAG: hypothetical protein P4L90_21545 [Rhodopila sp.]|nr:hypothetical protein [Rhodopila sp.]
MKRIVTALLYVFPPTGTAPSPARRYRRHARLGLIALCASSVLGGAVARAQDGGGGQPHVAAAMQADQGVEALLRQVEQQITSGHTMAPEGDNALVTWHRLLEVVSPASPSTLKALTDFAAYTRSRAAEEQAAGRLVVASDLTVFADQATELLQRESTAPAASSAAAPPVAPADNVRDKPTSTVRTDVATQGAQPSETPNGSAPPAAPAEPQRSEIPPAQTEIPPAASPAPSAAVALAAVNKDVATPAAPVASNTGVAAAVPAPHPSVPARTAKEQAAAAAFASRGDAMLVLQDITAARLFYEYAANAGSARAAAALAKTYDPVFLNQIGAVGTKPDPAMAANWYRKAAALGDREAEARLRTLGAEAAQ